MWTSSKNHRFWTGDFVRGLLSGTLNKSASEVSTSISIIIDSVDNKPWIVFRSF